MTEGSFLQFLPLIPNSEVTDGCSIPVEIGGQKFLIINENGNTYVIKNACGHFEMPLDTSEVKNGNIICSHHGISFDLVTGQIANRPWENCDSLHVYESDVTEGFLGVFI